MSLKWVTQAVKEITVKEYDYDANSCTAFLAAVRDIEKCGTKEFSFYDLNHKYGAGEAYVPQQGDYLRKENQGFSMMLAGWNEGTKVAAVINGSWPITMRKVEVQTDENTSDKEYQIGRVNDIVIPDREETDEKSRSSRSEKKSIKPVISSQIPFSVSFGSDRWPKNLRCSKSHT